ncbi:hypothetical protein WAE56_09640 [Iodobacter sp. LRB]|uniref:hypothetical protein n=1 Tax=unclassified Iodobacter TaxID=235634 RepID=UPI00117A9925|nr:hypothetical protein [Iodobacter sp. BJB302]
MKILICLIVFIFSSTIYAETTNNALLAYSYTSPSAQKLLKKYEITAKALEEYSNSALKKYTIQAINPGAVYEDSEDALRIDIRSKKSNVLSIELSVRQGASINNMLERWSKKTILTIKEAQTPAAIKIDLFNSIDFLLNDLKINYNSTGYAKGKLMMD